MEVQDHLVKNDDLMQCYHNIECGLLPLEHRFIVCAIGETRWIIPMKPVLDRAVRYYRKIGWYEGCELRDDPSLGQPRGRELRDVVEVNANLEAQAREACWSQLHRAARLLAGEPIIPPNDDQLWWFTEQPNGAVCEMTDLRVEEQEPLGGRPLWFSDAWARTRPKYRAITAKMSKGGD